VRRPSFTGRLSTFRRAFVSTFTLDVVARVLAGASAILLLRALSVEDFAFVVLFLAVGQFVGTAATGGVRMRHLRTEAERVSRGLEEPSSFTTALVGGTVVIAALAALAFPAALLAGVAGSTSDVAVFMALAAAYAVGQAASELVIFHLQAHLAFFKAGMVGVIRSALLLAVAIAAIAGLLSSGVATAAALTCAVLALAIVAVWPVLTGGPSRPALTGVRSAGGWLERRLGLGSESGWLTVYYVASAGFANVEIFVIAAILDKIDVASYGAAQRYYAIVLGAAPALVAVFRVRTSQHDVVDSPEVQREMLLNWIRRTAAPVGAALLATALAAPYLIPVIDGGRYPQSITVFQVLLIAAFVIYVTMPGSNLLMSQRRFRALALVLGAGVIGTLLGNVVAGALFGVVGVAVAACSVNSAITLYIARLALRRDAGSGPPAVVAGQAEPARAGRAG
jgi:O-antigen/teichoic acid export membrane protein